MGVNITSNTTTELKRWNGGRGTFGVQGVPDGATADLQADLDGDGFVPVGPDTTIVNAEGFGNFELPEGDIQVVTTGGGGSIDINVACKQIPRNG